MNKHVMMRPTISVFFPLGCSAAGRLFGWTRTRLEPFAITVVVLGTLSESRSKEVLVKTGADVEDGQLELVGRLRSDVSIEGDEDLRLLWMEWELDEEALPRLINFSIRIPHPENLETKVFYYDSPRFGISHVPSLTSSSNDRTVFVFAMEAMNTSPWINNCVNHESRKPLSRSDAWLMHSASTPSKYVPFMTGRLMSSCISKWWSHGEKLDLSNTASLNQALLKNRHSFLSQVLEFILAFFCVYYLHLHKTIIFDQVSVWTIKLNQMLMENAIWLSDNPAGIKLHRPLAMFYSNCIQTSAAYTFLLHQYLIKILHYTVNLLLLLSTLGGISMVLGILCDLVYLAAAPWSLVYAMSSIAMGLHKKALISTWKLLRGVYAQEKRKHKRRRNLQQDQLFGREKTTKDDEILMEHLIVGVLLFTPSLALIPTTFVFFGFSFCLHLLSLILRGSLMFFIFLLKTNPVILGLLRLVYPGLFPGMVDVDCLGVSERGIDCAYYALEVIPRRTLPLPQCTVWKLPFWVSLPWLNDIKFLGLHP